MSHNHITKTVAISILGGAACVFFSPEALAQSPVTSSIVIKNTTSGSRAASVNTNENPGGCQATTGSGSAGCALSAQMIPVGGSVTATAMYQASNAYNTLYSANVEFYLSTLDPGINTQSSTNCSWQIQIVKQLSQYGQPWQGNIKYSGTQDTNTPLVPACSYSNFSVNSSTGQYSVTLTFGGS